MTSNTAPTTPEMREYDFDAMNMQVGGRIQFITHRNIKPIQHFSMLVGYIKDEYLIVKVPVDNGTFIALSEGDKLTIRVFSGVTVCSFSCSVLRVFARPLNYVHITFPDSIQGTSLRKAMRVRVDIPAHLTAGDGMAVPVSLLNVSVSGALIEAPVRLAVEQAEVSLSFNLTAQGEHEIPIETRATIQNMNIAKPATEVQSEMFTYGVQFVDLQPTHYMMLQNLTYEALIADRQKIV